MNDRVAAAALRAALRPRLRSRLVTPLNVISHTQLRVHVAVVLARTHCRSTDPVPSFISAEILCLANIPRVEIIVLKSGVRGTLSGTSGSFLGSTAFAGDAFFGGFMFLLNIKQKEEDETRKRK